MKNKKIKEPKKLSMSLQEWINFSYILYTMAYNQGYAYGIRTRAKRKRKTKA